VPDSIDPLERARRDLELSIDDLWTRYFALGGMSTLVEVEAVLFGALVGTGHDRELLAVALDERFSELGRDPPIRCVDDRPDHP
jgi:hypothetical protein